MLEATLYYSYNPACVRAGISSDICKAVSEDTPYIETNSLVTVGTRALQEAFDEELQLVGTDGTHVVPLSSGLDSRTVLGSLLAHPEIDSQQIQTVTYGTPGTWDYELSQQTASTVGISNTVIDLTADSFDWSVEALRRYARTREAPTRILEGYVHARVANRFGEDAVIWSGFLGDPSVGGHQPANPADDWDTAREWFIKSNRATTSLTTSQFEPDISLPTEPYLHRAQLSYEEQLDFAHRQQCLIAPLVLYEPDRYATPFARQEWLAFGLNLPRKHRRNRTLFSQIVQQQFPELFSVPTDANAGLPLDASTGREFVRSVRLKLPKGLARVFGFSYTPPSTNYVNFASQFRERGKQLATTAETLLKAFDRREIAPWLDTMELWDCHQSGENLATEIRILCSLELFYSSR